MYHNNLYVKFVVSPMGPTFVLTDSVSVLAPTWLPDEPPARCSVKPSGSRHEYAMSGYCNVQSTRSAQATTRVNFTAWHGHQTCNCWIARCCPQWLGVIRGDLESNSFQWIAGLGSDHSCVHSVILNQTDSGVVFSHLHHVACAHSTTSRCVVDFIC